MSAALQITELERQNAQLSAQLSAARTQLETLGAEYAALKQQLEWFKRQLFGVKSERRLDVHPAEQGNLLAALGVQAPPAPPIEALQTVRYERRKKCRDAAVNDAGLRFGPDVPLRVVQVVDPAIEAIPPEQRELIDEKVSYRLAQSPGSYTIIELRRPVYKLRNTSRVLTAAAPANVLERSVADVSLLAGLLIDKFCYHLPLYRQHQRMRQCGIQLSRASLTSWVGRAIDLLRPIAVALSAQVLASRVLAMDETPIKAGREHKGKMREAYLWPIYGERDEVIFHYAPSREHRHVANFLAGFGGTLLTDGYAAYSAYAASKSGITHANCWAHCRRGFEQAKEAEPQATEQALALIGTLYRHEAIIRERGLEGEAKLAYRTEHSEPVVRAFWQWCDTQCRRGDLLPSNPLAKAIVYARARIATLGVFLADPDVPIDTNHLERSLRVIPTGRRNWLFCWTEIGAERTAVIQSLLVTCRLHGVDPYVYLVDVLQRISEHPASRVAELTPREWKARFADNPMRSIIDTPQ